MNVKFDGKDKLIISVSNTPAYVRDREIEVLKNIDWIGLFSAMESDFATNWRTYVRNKDFIEGIEYFIHLEMLDSALESLIS
jgi:hypothetical protein